MADLSDKDRAFVDTYLRPGNAAEAAKEAGYGARSAGRVMALPQVSEAIQAAQSAAETPSAGDGVSIEDLLKQADAAYQAALDQNNPNGMVSAISLRAKLSGLADAPKPAAKSEIAVGPVDVEAVSRAILTILSRLADETGFQVGFAGPDEMLLRVNRAMENILPDTAVARPIDELIDKLPPLSEKPTSGLPNGQEGQP